jgi:hypothetical protein
MRCRCMEHYRTLALLTVALQSIYVPSLATAQTVILPLSFGGCSLLHYRTKTNPRLPQIRLPLQAPPHR